jgi:hypothetical protein
VKTDDDLMGIFACIANDPFVVSDADFEAAVQKMGLTYDEVKRMAEIAAGVIKKIVDAFAAFAPAQEATQ